MLQTVALGFQWPTVDPFLFCVHHDDAYPPGDEGMAPPREALRGRQIGSDFTPTDGWRMYHGTTVPGFPQHPHRGFETVTYVRRGVIDHSDSMGAAARFGAGDTQWLTAGGGIQHCEMFPLLRSDDDNHLELFQIWVNLPAVDKMVDPYFTMFWAEQQPRHDTVDAHGRSASLTVIAGSVHGLQPMAPPPNSWASRPDADVAIWHLTFEPGSHLVLPAAKDGTVRVVYVFVGDGVHADGHPIGGSTGAVLDCSSEVTLTAGATPCEALVLQGRPIGEPVVQHGPFVMNDRAGIEQAFADYRRTQFGGWPWPVPDPVHRRNRGRFARHADGRVEEPDPLALA